jgi:transmembrane protein TMEM260 (protein O-mannosyltransferase)
MRSTRRAPSTPRAVRPAPAVPWWASAAVGAAFGGLYLALAPPVVGGKDASEVTVVLALAGAPHATGYPLFTLLGHAFVVMLRGLGASWAYAANAWSATGGAVAMALHHALAARVVPTGAPAGRWGRFALALVATALIGMNPVWMIDAMLAEVYSWHLAWVCGVGLFALSLGRVPGEPRSSGSHGANAGTWRRLEFAAAGWGLLSGIGMAHHVTAVLFIAPLSLGLVLTLVRAKLWRGSLIAWACGASLLPLASYGFILYRAFHPAAFQWQVLEPSWRSVIAHVTGAEYRDLLGKFAPSDIQKVLFRIGIDPVLFPGLVVTTWVVLRERKGPERWVLRGLAAAAAIQTLYGYSYGVSDPSSYFQPSLAIAVLGVPMLGAWLWRHARLLPVAGSLAVIGLVALGAAWIPLGFEVRQGTVLIERQVHGLWRTLPEREAIVLFRHDMLPALRGYQLLDGERPGLYVQDPYALTWAGPRRAFVARFGFDPLAGLLPVTARKLALIPENINRQTALPVYVFDQSQQAIQPLAKAEADLPPGQH